MNNNIIIEIYVRLINEYFSIMTQSDILKYIQNKRFIIYIGLNAIYNIFKINLITTKNIQTSYYYCEKACYCYLEYIEQINKSEALNSLNVNDVVKFVYKETILYNDDKPTTPVTTNYYTNIDYDNLHDLFSILSRVSSLLLNWNNENMDETLQSIICQKYLLKYLYLFYNNNIVEYIDYLETILEKLKMDKETYIDFLEHFHKKMKNKHDTSKHEIQDKIMIFLRDYDNIEIAHFIKTFV
jgi:hypothetical protein